MIRQHHCEALYAAGRIIEAGKSLNKILKKEVYKRGLVAAWVSG